MNMRACLALLALLAANPARAGHGLMNSFADIEWLGAPRVTPDAWYYDAVTLQETLALRFAGSSTAAGALCLAGMREKLAEALAMVRKADANAARVALARHAAYLDHALALNAGDDWPPRLARSLLEQRYMISVEFPDLPAPARAPLERWMDDSGARYDALRATLPRATVESLFFKEEEVRWSWQMARRPVDDAPPPGL